MERNSNENFEHFLRQNAEDFRMHPSPKVWEGISENLIKKKRRFYLGFITLLVSSSILGYTILEYSTSRITKTNPAVNTPTNTKTATTMNKTNSPVAVITRPNSTTEGTAITQENRLLLNKKLPVSPKSQEETVPESENGTQKESWLAELYLARNSTQFSLQPSISQNPLDITAIESDNKPNPTDNVASKTGKGKKLSFMFFFTPTVSYRKLSENKSYLRSPSPLGVPYSYAALYDVNNAVTHKPSIGLELGFTSKYALTKNVKLRAGLQFNINRYDIKAFKYMPEVATIALNSGRSGVEVVSAGSSYRNFNGGQDEWLQNFYFQASVPIGAEVKLHGNDKMYIGAASTIQPTYVLSDNSYLITSDYKNYAQVPWLMRRLNVNTNLETFVAYSTGKLKWQVGPQVRYQLLSSFVNKYPVKENLFDFGLKVGISANTK
jgi:hypothetical protein